MGPWQPMAQPAIATSKRRRRQEKEVLQPPDKDFGWQWLSRPADANVVKNLTANDGRPETLRLMFHVAIQTTYLLLIFFFYFFCLCLWDYSLLRCEEETIIFFFSRYYSSGFCGLSLPSSPSSPSSCSPSSCSFFFFLFLFFFFFFFWFWLWLWLCLDCFVVVASNGISLRLSSLMFSLNPAARSSPNSNILLHHKVWACLFE